MNKTFIITALVFYMCNASSQNDPFKKWIDSFEKTSDQGPCNFRVLLNKGKNMTKEQAVEFVYQNDTSKLYCHFQEFNMETEKQGAFTTELYLPQKCLKLTTSKFILIGYSTFKCDDPDKLLEMYLTLKIIDRKGLRSTDSLIVYRGNEYDWQMTGLINPQNNKIFILEQLGKSEFNARAFIYKIDNALRFEIEKRQEGIKEITDNLEEGVESLGWSEIFSN